MKIRFLFLLLIIFLSSCAKENPTSMEIDMKNSAGDSLGKVKLSEQANGVQIDLDLKGLPPGVHGFHFHEKPVCKGPSFESAGNHFNPEDKEHGLLNVKGAHAGDLPNLDVGEDGKIKEKVMASKVSLREGKNSLLFDKGTSLVINKDADDGMSQPAGNSGKRIACGEIKKQN